MSESKHMSAYLPGLLSAFHHTYYSKRCFLEGSCYVRGRFSASTSTEMDVIPRYQLLQLARPLSFVEQQCRTPLEHTRVSNKIHNEHIPPECPRGVVSYQSVVKNVSYVLSTKRIPHEYLAPGFSRVIRKITSQEIPTKQM